MPPVSIYVGYSIEERGTARGLVFGVACEAAERLAALLPGERRGRAEDLPRPAARCYRPPVRGLRGPTGRPAGPGI